MIEDYIEYVSLKRKELGGHAICPFAKAFLDKIEIIESDDFFTDAKQSLNAEEHPVLYLIYGNPDKFTINWLDNFCTQHQESAQSKDLWLIWDHPEQINKINGIRTSNKEYAILFIQPLSELNKYSDKLKHTNYYGFWDKKYYNQIVESRKKT